MLIVWKILIVILFNRGKCLIYITMSKSQRGYNSICIIYKNLYVKTVRNIGQMLKTKHHQNWKTKYIDTFKLKGFRSVSYTHLDVYKRQALYPTVLCPHQTFAIDSMVGATAAIGYVYRKFKMWDIQLS